MIKNKNRIFMLIAAICFVLGLGLYFKTKQNALPPEQAERVKNICFFYKYDKNNPGVHGGLGPQYHAEQFKNYEAKYGPSGVKDVAEFCEKLDKN